MKEPRGGKKRIAGYQGALRTYLRSIHQYPFLSASDEHQIAIRVREQGNEAGHALVEANLRLVAKIAHEYRHAGIPVEDLISEGNIGLIESARRFDPARGVRFSSYAAWWIRKYMVAALSRNILQVSSPVPAGAEDQEAAGVSGPGAESNRSARQRLISIDDFTRGDGDRGVLEKIAAETEDPHAPIFQRELADEIRAVLPSMSKQERLILTTRYGLDGETPMTLLAIGRAMGFTRERVRQLEVKALARARRLILARRVGRS